VAVFRTDASSPRDRPAYFIELTFHEGRVKTVKDFRYVPYIGADARLLLDPARSPPSSGTTT